MTRAEEARRLISCLDLTDLHDECTAADVDALIARAATPEGDVAAICIWPRFVEHAKRKLSDGIRCATVVNFPAGGEDAEATAEETRNAIEDGADEIDLVIPYRRVAADPAFVEAMVREVKAAAGRAPLKAILETGELADPELIERAAKAALSGGADFLKTSTGKTKTSATPEAARILLQAIRDGGRPRGFKPSGGIKTFEDAKSYRDMANEIMGANWAGPRTFRLGASGVLADLLAVAGGAERPGGPAGY